jgi:hypothetical protein
VRNRLFFMEGQRRRQQAHTKAAVLAAHLDYDRLGPQVAEWIGHYVDTHGTGPLWREVGEQWGWDRIHTDAILKATRRAGWVTSTERPRSLRPSNPTLVQAPSGCLNSAEPRTGHRPADDARR